MRETGSQLTILNQVHKYLESNSKSITQNFAQIQHEFISTFKGFRGHQQYGEASPGFPNHDQGYKIIHILQLILLYSFKPYSSHSISISEYLEHLIGKIGMDIQKLFQSLQFHVLSPMICSSSKTTRTQTYFHIIESVWASNYCAPIFRASPVKRPQIRLGLRRAL